MSGCLSILMRILADAVIARILQEIIRRLTGAGRISWIAAILALFGIRLARR